MFTRFMHTARRAASVAVPLAACLGAGGLALPAHAGVNWSIGISAPIAPGVQIGTVIDGGHRHHHHRPPVAYVPAPVIYAPPPPVVYAPPVYAAPVVYAPPRVVYRPAVVVPRYPVYRAPVVVRPGYHGGGRHGGHPEPVRVSDRQVR